MPGRLNASNDTGFALRQIVASTTDADFLDSLIDSMKGSNLHELHETLDRFTSERDADIEYMCTSNHQEFVDSVQKLDEGRNDCASLGKEILNLVDSYQQSTRNLAEQKKNLVDSRSVRQNIDESADALKDCLEVLRLANQVHDLVAKQYHYAALRALDELQTLLQLRESARYKIGDMIEKSIPAIQQMIAEAVMSDLNTWLYRLREVSQYIGEVSFYYTEQRRSRQRDRAERDAYLSTFKLNSPLELVADEMEEYDVLNDEQANLEVDFTPLYECIHIHEALGQSDKFRATYANTRRRQKELIIPSTLRINDDEASDLKTLLESIAGFSIVERATMKRTNNLRTNAEVDELWDSMSQSVINLMSGAVQDVKNKEVLLRITGVVSQFIQTMESWGFYANALNAFLMTLFSRHATLAKNKCSEDFEEIVATDDYMPFGVSDIEEYDGIIKVGWYTPEKDREDVEFPVYLPFSQMYPMVCIDIRNFLHDMYSAPDEYLTRSSAIDDMVRETLDELLSDRLCKPLVNRLSSQYPGQVVQILTNVEHFEKASQELEIELARARTSRSKIGPVTLRSTEEFRKARDKARERIFELVKSKMDDLVETAEYDWNMKQHPTEPSNYIVEMTQYLSDMITSVLVNVPNDIKDMIYVEALKHAATNILQLPLDPSVNLISPATLQLMNLDVDHLNTFIESVRSASGGGLENLDSTTVELRQTLALLTSSDPEEFFDIDKRTGRYSAVNAQTGAVLLEKVERGKESHATMAPPSGPQIQPEKQTASDRFGQYVRGFRRGADNSTTGGANMGSNG